MLLSKTRKGAEGIEGAGPANPGDTLRMTGVWRGLVRDPEFCLG